MITTYLLAAIAMGVLVFLVINLIQIRRVKKGIRGVETVGHSMLVRDLTEFDVTMVGVGAMIGAGIFVLTGIAAGIAGPALMLAFLFNGFLIFLTAAAYAELGSAVPEAGGEYLWIKSAFGGYQAFMGGWMSWFAHVVAGSLYALGFGSYFVFLLIDNHLLDGKFFDPASKLVATIIILVFATINFIGTSETGKVGNIITIMKVIVIGLFIISGLWVIFLHFNDRLSHYEPFFPRGFESVFMAMGFTFIAFEGHEIIVQTGEEVENPQTSIPRAIFKALMIVIPIYVLVAFTALGAIVTENGITPWEFLENAGELGLAEAAKQFMPLGATLLLLAGLISTLSALNATTFSSARMSFVMGREKLLPQRFGEVNEWSRTPHVAIFASAFLMFLIAAFLPIKTVAAAADLMFLLLFLQANRSLLRIRKNYGDKLTFGYQTPFFPLFPILAIIGKLFIMIFLLLIEPIAVGGTVIWLLLGTILWLVYSKRNASLMLREDPFAAYLRFENKKEDLET